MNPIFNEYIKFLNDTSKTKVYDLKEGYFWLDKSIIKGFDKNGNVHKFYRVKIEDDLSVDIIKPKSGYDNVEDIDIASWQDLVELNLDRLQSIENESLQLIENKMNKFHNYTPIIPVSMGKDSMVTAYLVRSLYPDTKAIFNNTSLDVGDTYKMAKSFPNCEIMNPKKGFYQYVDKDKMIPTRFARFCCRIFKVGVMVEKLDHNHPYLMWMGMRNEESATRSGYEDEWINTSEWGNTCWQGILPIRKWSELDVWLYTIWRGIEINKKYKYGYSRVGCAVACPYYTKSTWVLDKYFYNNLYERWRSILKKDFIENKKWLIMNCTIKEYLEMHECWELHHEDIIKKEMLSEKAPLKIFTDDYESKYKLIETKDEFNDYISSALDCDTWCRKKLYNKMKELELGDGFINQFADLIGNDLSKYHAMIDLSNEVSDKDTLMYLYTYKFSK